MKIKHYVKPVLTAAVLSLTLSGCVGAVLGGAAVGGKSLADRRTTGAQADDSVMSVRVENTIRSYLRQNNQVTGYTPTTQSRVKIVTYDNVTYIMGILTPEEQEQVTRKVSTTYGVQKVVTLYQNYVKP